MNLQTAAQYKKECERAEEENKLTTDNLENVEANLSDVQEKLENLRVEKDKAAEAWMIEVCGFQGRVHDDFSRGRFDKITILTLCIQTDRPEQTV